MSTRETYGFRDRNNHKTFVYIHYDGYLSGAAMYFYETIMNPSKGNLATQFIRANPHAEITRSHECHADTDFMYDIEGNGVEAVVTAYQLGEERHFLKYVGLMRNFITEHHDMIEHFQPFKQVAFPYNSQWLNTGLAKRRLDSPVSHLSAWRGRFENGANWDGCMRELRAILDAFPELITEVPDWLHEHTTSH